jgi:DNA mismatch repair protein MutS
VIFLRRLVPGGADKSYGLHVARLAGVPDEVVAHAEQVMARFQTAAADDEVAPAGTPEGASVRERSSEYAIPGQEREVENVIRELCAVDIANLTPVQALVALNEWQGRLRSVETMRGPVGDPQDSAASNRKG